MLSNGINKKYNETKACWRATMEQFEFNYKASRKVPKRSHVGVVGSGDLEVLLEPADGASSSVLIRTSAAGFKPTWKAVLDRFFSEYDGAARIEINDAGATPGAVLLRLQQAVEASER
jgi:malonate decarboxylase delta subunit